MTDRTIPSAAAPRAWRKSSYSGSEAGSCLEVLDGHVSGVPVRDSKTPTGPALLFSAAHWSLFISGVKEGGFPT